MRKGFFRLQSIQLTIGALAVIACAAVFFWLTHTARHSSIGISTDSKIDITPEQIRSIKAIGEWEFLSVTSEEMVDTMRRGLFSDDHLVRIYYGTLRIGVNMHQVKPGWIKTSGDSITVTLPAVGLLDNDFIDEARTKSFYESGRWTAADREAMYRRASRQMREHALTKENIRSAENNADAQFRGMFRSMGYNNIIIRFGE